MIKKLILGALPVALAAGMATTSAQAVELKMASFTGPKHPMNSRVFVPWAKQIGEMSNGSLTVKPFFSGALGKGPAKQFKRTIDGVCDICWGLQGYTSKQFRRTLLIEMPNVGADAMVRTKKLWSIYNKYLANEYDKVKVLAIWSLDAPVIMTKKKPVNRISDLKGMKIRTPSQSQARLIAGLGATPLAMPITKLYNALDRGLVDGVLVSPTVLKSFKIHEVTKYFTSGLPWGSSAFFAVMNKASWDKLSQTHKDLLNKTSGEALSMKAATVYQKAGDGGLKFIADSDKHEMITFSDAEKKRGVEMLAKTEAEMIAELEKGGIPAAQILAAIRSAGS